MFAPRQHQRVNHALGSNRRLGRLLQLSIEKGNIKARVVRHERREESGKVEICGTIAGGGNRLKFTWEERGGPRVAAPTRRGFRTSLLKAIFTDVRIDYSVEGVTCEIDLPLDRTQSGAAAAAPFKKSDQGRT
jgi:hypothetical protein